MRYLLLILMLASPAWAVEPSEMLDDPAMEARARVISKGLRCVVCQNENIDDSNAGIAADLRVLVRERLVEGDSDEAVVQYVVDRYGEYVLLKPRFSTTNMVLWLTGPLLLLFGGIGAFVFIRQRSKPAADEGLDAEEQARLVALLKDN